MARVFYRLLHEVMDPKTGQMAWEPVRPQDVREFTSIQPRLEAKACWERMGEDYVPRDIATEPRVAAPAWADMPGPGTAAPFPPVPEGEGLVVVRSPRRRGKGQPADTISGTDLEPGE